MMDEMKVSKKFIMLFNVYYSTNKAGHVEGCSLVKGSLVRPSIVKGCSLDQYTINMELYSTVHSTYRKNYLLGRLS